MFEPKHALLEKFSDPATEWAVLAALKQNPDLWPEVQDRLHAEVFTEARAAFEEVAAALNAGKEVPAADDKAEPAADVHTAVARILELHARRAAGAAVEKLLRDLWNSDRPTSELLAEFEMQLARVTQTLPSNEVSRYVSMAELLPDVLRDVARRRQAVKERGAAAIGLPTGIKALDKLLGGLQPGIHMLAAEPGAGKTTFCLQVAAHVSRSGYPALFVTFEESAMRLVLKAVCSAAQMPFKDFTEGFGDVERLRQAARDHLPDLERVHFLEGNSRTTLLQVKAKAVKAMERCKTDKCLIVIDYLQRWAALSKQTYQDFRFAVASMAAELRDLSMTLDSPVLVISSQNRSGQGQATLTSLKESGDLEYAADSVMFLTVSDKRDATPPAVPVDLKVLKNRYGAKGTVPLIFRGDLATFREVAAEVTLLAETKVRRGRK